jgi:hypothetical protein
MEILKKTASLVVSTMIFIIFTIYLKSLFEFIFQDGLEGSSIAINFIKFNLFIIFCFLFGCFVFWIIFITVVRVIQSIFSPNEEKQKENIDTQIAKLSLDFALDGGDVSVDDSIIDRVGELTIQFLESQSITEFDLNDYSNIMFKLFAFMNVRGIEFPSERVSDKRNYIETCLSKFKNFEIKNSRVKLITLQSNKEKMDAVYSKKKEAKLGWQTIDEEEKKMRSQVINGVISEEDLKDYFENKNNAGAV